MLAKDIAQKSCFCGGSTPVKAQCCCSSRTWWLLGWPPLTGSEQEHLNPLHLPSGSLWVTFHRPAPRNGDRAQGHVQVGAELGVLPRDSALKLELPVPFVHLAAHRVDEALLSVPCSFRFWGDCCRCSLALPPLSGYLPALGCPLTAMIFHELSWHGGRGADCSAISSSPFMADPMHVSH